LTEQAVVFLVEYDTTDKLIEQVAEMGGGQMSKERQVQQYAEEGKKEQQQGSWRCRICVE